MKDNAIRKIEGKAIALRGDDIDTDRIIPARYLRCVTFDGLGEHVFEDDRRALQERKQVHPFDEEQYQKARILVVNKNFGCGSSREHAPQALMRWGIQAIVGESFAEIFFGNCVSLGVPCLTASDGDVRKLQEGIHMDPVAEWVLHLDKPRIEGTYKVALSMPEGARKQFVEGTWNALSELLSDYDEVQRVADDLPYVGGWQKA